MDNPPAFPNPMIPEWQEGSTGMSLRDWFAGQALAGLCSDPKMSTAGDAHLIPAVAYAFADKMLLSRQQEKG